MGDTFTFDELFNMSCSFARQIDDEPLFLSFMATMFKAHADENGLNLVDYVNSFAEFIKFSESPESEQLTKLFTALFNHNEE